MWKTWEDPPGEGNDYLLQYSGLENPRDRGAWPATVHGIEKSRTRLRDFHTIHMLLLGEKFFNVLGLIAL